MSASGGPTGRLRFERWRRYWRRRRDGACSASRAATKLEKCYPKYFAHADVADKGKVYINEEQCFEGVRPEVWEFHIGGYQVCEKWLKDRRGRELSFDDIRHYQKVVVALGETIRLMEEPCLVEMFEAKGSALEK